MRPVNHLTRAEAARILARAEDENGFMGWVLEYAHARFWRVAHFRPALTAKGWRTAVAAEGVGFPDLVLARAPRLVVAELKTNRGPETAAQREWRAVFEGCAGVEMHLWRPKDRPEIERILL